MTILVALIALIAPPAYANDPPAEESDTTLVSAAAGAVGIGLAKADGGAGGTSSANQNQTQSAVSGAQATNAGNSQSVESHYREIRQAPASFAPAIYASGPCAYGWSAGVSFPGGSANGGRAKADPNCDRREIVRILTPLNPALALKVACADPLVKEVASTIDCAMPEVVVENTAPTAPTLDLSRYVTREELAERDRRIMQRSTSK